jgi:hypothetical protein
VARLLYRKERGESKAKKQLAYKPVYIFPQNIGVAVPGRISNFGIRV